MKHFLIFLLLISFAQLLLAQESSKIDRIAGYFNEIKTATSKHKRLWGIDLYGPILLVNRQTRQIFANEPDTANILKPNGAIYIGTLPEDISIANTAVNWGGKRWAMIMLPLSENKYKRINLLAHELFHRAQPSLGFSPHFANNNHLDQKEGRIFLRLELEALKKALQSDGKERQRHLVHALAFRKYRHLLYPGSDIAENRLELNEGLAEFTGTVISGRNPKLMKTHLINSINDFLSNPTFVRSFAYETIPVYGYLLYSGHKNWPAETTAKTNLTTFFISAFQIGLPADLKKEVDDISSDYSGKKIVAEETARAEKNAKRVSEYRKKLIEQPHLEIPVLIQLKKLSVAFDPRTIIPLGDKGTVYPRIRVTDLWGTLIVENGAFITTGWTKIFITNPTDREGNKISGDGWTLELKPGYTVEKDDKSGNYTLKADKNTKLK